MHGFWALTLRTLRWDARQVRYHWLRAGAALIAWLGLWSQDLSPWGVTAPGRTVLMVLLGMNLSLVTLAGVLLFAPVISEEKETENLALLRMTGMGPAAVVLGCSLPRLIQLGLIVMSQFPVLGLTVTLGGVTWSQVWAAAAMVFFQMILVPAIGVLCSAYFRTSGKAVTAALTLMFLWGWVSSDYNGLSMMRYFESYRQFSVLPEGLLTVSVIHGVLALICLGSAIAILDRFDRHEHLNFASLSFRNRFLARRRRAPTVSDSSCACDSPPAVSGARTPIPIGRHPLAWKEFHFLGGGRPKFRWRAIIAFCCAVGCLMIHGSLSQDAGESMMSLAFWFLGADLVYLSVNLLGPEIRNQTWESLRLVPVSIGSICLQKSLGAARHLIPWLLLLFLGIIQSGTVRYWLHAWERDPVTSLFAAVQFAIHSVAIVFTLIRTSLSFNPWIAILVSSVVQGVILTLLGITALMTFGIFGPPAVKATIVAFNLTWIIGLLLYIWFTALTIRNRLNAA